MNKLFQTPPLINAFRNVFKAQQFLSQPFTIDMVVRPEEPYYQLPGITPDGIEMDGENLDEYNDWLNWKPVFELCEYKWSESPNSYWYGLLPEKSIRVEKKRINTLDDFIRECQKSGIELTYNKEYEI